MVWDELTRDAESENVRDRDRWIGVYIGVLAVLLAICSMGGGNAAKDATLKNIEAANTWAFFQAKNMRRHVLRVEADDLALRLMAEADLTADGRTAIEAKISDYKKQDEALTVGDTALPVEQREGLDQLFEKGKRLEAERDLRHAQRPLFRLWRGAAANRDRAGFDCHHHQGLISACRQRGIGCRRRTADVQWFYSCVGCAGSGLTVAPMMP